MRIPALAGVVLALAACQTASYPYQANATEEFELAAAGVETLGCRTHNGRIEIRGVADAESIRVRASKSVAAVTRAEAEAALEKVEVVREVRDGRARLDFVLHDQDPSRWWGGVSFDVTVPAGLGATVRSHNGPIALDGLGGALEASTHNGGIRVEGDFDGLHVSTHNGAIEATVDGDGPLDGLIDTHNGGVALRIAGSRSTRIEASTHNGSLRVQGAQIVESRRRALTAEVGDAAGRMLVDTHNGGVVVEVVDRSR